MAVLERPLRPGEPIPLGVTIVKDGVNFALFSEHATAVELLLFSHPDDKEPKEIIPVKEKTGDIWHVLVPGIRPGQLYAYKVNGSEIGAPAKAISTITIKISVTIAPINVSFLTCLIPISLDVHFTILFFAAVAEA